MATKRSLGAAPSAAEVSASIVPNSEGAQLRRSSSLLYLRAVCTPQHRRQKRQAGKASSEGRHPWGEAGIRPQGNNRKLERAPNGSLWLHVGGEVDATPPEGQGQGGGDPESFAKALKVGRRSRNINQNQQGEDCEQAQHGPFPFVGIYCAREGTR